MALIACPECKQQVSSQAKACPGCAAPLKRSAGSVVLRVFLALLAAFIVIFVFAIWRGSDPQVQAMQNDRAAYDLCIQKQRETLGNPIVSGACKMMRDKFYEKYRREP